MLRETRKIGDFEVTTVCLQSYPCKHGFRRGKQAFQLCSGDVIARQLKAAGLSDPHFDVYLMTKPLKQ